MKAFKSLWPEMTVNQCNSAEGAICARDRWIVRASATVLRCWLTDKDDNKLLCYGVYLLHQL